MSPIRLLVALTALVAAGLAAEPDPGLPFRTFREQFATGDKIVIEQVWIRGAGLRIGDSIPVGEPEQNPDRKRRPGLHLGDTVVVRGRYTLQSEPQARLGLSLTTRAPGGPTPVSPKAWQNAPGGSGTFELEYVVRNEGELHVTFYPKGGGSSFGGVYFQVLR